MRSTIVKEDRRNVIHGRMSSWDALIEDAEGKLLLAIERCQRLREIVADLKKLRASGQMFPGKSATHNQGST
jgi:hypothetical protein